MKFTSVPERGNYFLSQPHQPFFVLGVINSIVFMLLFALNYKGVFELEISTLNFHVFSMIFLIFTNLFTGFLFTTFPRFCGVSPIDKKYYINIFYISILATIFYIIGSFIHISILAIGMLFSLYANYKIVAKLREIYISSSASNLEDSFWILRSNYFGITGHILFIISIYFTALQNFAIIFSFFMYLIFLTFSVGQRMIPFFSHSIEEKDARFVSTVFALFILKTILATFNSYDYIKIAEIIVDILLALYMLGEFLRWKILDKNAHPILWILHLALFWLPAAFLIDAISLGAELYLNTSFYFLGVHLIALGFLTTVLIGFGTRVTYGHSGQPPQANGLVLGLFYFTQVVVLFRFLYSLNIGLAWELNFLFDLSFTAWLILFILWAIKFLPILIKASK